MTSINQDAGVTSALDSILGRRLVVLLGAGLSIPSGLPSAWTIAQQAKARYDAMFGTSRAPLSTDIEEQAAFFHRDDRLGTFYVPTLVDPHAFAGHPNLGHTAVADFLLTGAVRGAVSTNYDTLIETAGQNLYGAVGSALDGAETTRVPHGTALLKAHGCWGREPENTVWTPEQLNGIGTVANRLRSTANWLSVTVPNSDLLVVGFWSDWSYLNGVLGDSLGQITPGRVTIVDPAPAADLQAKAPKLYEVGQRATRFEHVQESGDTFLDALRREFSRTFVRRTLHAGAASFKSQNAAVTFDDAWTEPSIQDNNTLWQVRRDIQGCLPHQPATQHDPPTGEALGLTMIELQAAGAVPEGPYWRLPSDELVRVLNGSNRALDIMKAEYDRDMTPVTSPSVVVAVGADDSPLPGSIARSNPATAAKASSVRGAQPQWLTRSHGFADLLA